MARKSLRYPPKVYDSFNFVSFVDRGQNSTGLTYLQIWLNMFRILFDILLIQTKKLRGSDFPYTLVELVLSDCDWIIQYLLIPWFFNDTKLVKV